MARRYHLPCKNCDEKILVETTQAGQTITCRSCKEPMRVGTLREIQALEADAPTPEESEAIKKSKTRMSPAKRLLFVAGILLLTIGGIWGAVAAGQASQLYRPKPSVETDERILKGIDSSRPAQLLAAWEELSSDDLVAEWTEHPYLTHQDWARDYRAYSWVGFGMAGLGVLCLIGAFVRNR